jgi:hypothetical protein
LRPLTTRIEVIAVPYNETGQGQDAGPIAALRETWGLTRTEFAAALGVGYMVAWNVETGAVTRIPRRMIAALADAGADVAALERDHARWIEARARGLRERIAVAGARA